jgi:hypothetical protein
VDRLVLPGLGPGDELRDDGVGVGLRDLRDAEPEALTGGEVRERRFAFALLLSLTTRARVVAAPAPPRRLAGRWTRIVTPADLEKGPKGPPAGRWTITVDSIGWAIQRGDYFDVRYIANGDVVMGPEVDTPTEQAGPSAESTRSTVGRFRSRPTTGRWC